MLDKHSFVADDGSLMDGQGYRLVTSDGEQLYGHDEEEQYLDHLDGFVTSVAGVSHHHRELQAEAFEPGRPLRLVPEPNNPYDANAVAVWDAGRTVAIGHLPRNVAADVAPAMRAGQDRQALCLWEWRKEGERVGLRIIVAPGIAAAG